MMRLLMVLYMVLSLAGPFSANNIHHDAWILARTAQGEADVLGVVAIDCVMWVIHNRLQHPQFPNSIKEVVVQQGDFGGYWHVKQPRSDVYKQALAFLRASKNRSDDPTNGALFVFGKKDIENYNLPRADWILADGEFELHFFEKIDWKAWRENQQGEVIMSEITQRAEVNGVLDLVSVQKEALATTIRLFGYACDFVTRMSEENNTKSRSRLHYLSYHPIRKEIDIPSQLVISALSRTHHAIKNDIPLEDDVITHDTNGHSVQIADDGSLEVSLAASCSGGRIRASVQITEHSGDPLEPGMKPVSFSTIKHLPGTNEFHIHLQLGK